MKIVFYMCVLIFVVVVIVLPFTNPDMTETRLFLTYWPIYLTGTFVILLTFYLAFDDD